MGESINTKVAELDAKIREQEFCMQEGFDIMSALVEFNSDQGVITCATAFASMHRALLSSISTDRTDYEWIFYWLRKFISLMQRRSFAMGGEWHKDGEYYVCTTEDARNKKKFSELLSEYSKPIYAIDAEIQKSKNYIKIKIEYERVMLHFKKRLADMLIDPIKVLSQEEIDAIMNT